jgi:hypothetical protein
MKFFASEPLPSRDELHDRPSAEDFTHRDFQSAVSS